MPKKKTKANQDMIDGEGSPEATPKAKAKYFKLGESTKIEILKKMNELKRPLFSENSISNPTSNKLKAWADVHAYAVSIGVGVDSPSRIRNAFNSWKKVTRIKRDLNRKTGSGRVDLTLIDQMVLDVAGRDCAADSFLGVPDTAITPKRALEHVSASKNPGGSGIEPGNYPYNKPHNHQLPVLIFFFFRFKAQ